MMTREPFAALALVLLSTCAGATPIAARWTRVAAPRSPKWSLKSTWQPPSAPIRRIMRFPLRNVRPLSGVKRPAEVVTEATACSTWWRICDESVECFGPYRTTRGALKAEAFDTCNVVASPEPECGLRSIS